MLHYIKLIIQFFLCIINLHLPIISVTSLVLSGVMGSRFARSGKFMPAGLVATLRYLKLFAKKKLFFLLDSNFKRKLKYNGELIFFIFQCCSSCAHVLPSDAELITRF